MSGKLNEKLTKLPTAPGVYFHKDKSGEIIYIGKAANLRNRVRQYFQKSRYRDPKTDVLVGAIADIDWTAVDNEADALFLEAELVRRYQPRFNILLRDDKSQLFVRVDYKSDYPTVTLIRRPFDDGAEYFGPYLNGPALKKALRYLRRAFPYATNQAIGQKRVNLHYHLGLDPGLEEGRTTLGEYRANLRKLMQYLRGERVALVREIEKEMKKAAAQHEFEKAAYLRNQLFSLRELGRQILFSDRELQDAARDQALVQLAELLNLYETRPLKAGGGASPAGAQAGPLRKLRRIEGFDISHMQGTDNVASMVVFINGVPDKAAYRKFKMKLAGNDDFAHMNETLARRLREENRKKWGLPDLVLIDGGKGQLTSALTARNNAKLNGLPMIGLAKHEEEIIIHKSESLPGSNPAKIINSAVRMGAYVSESGNFITVLLPTNLPAVKLLQRVRDESHRFAVSYHTVLKRTRQTGSILDGIPGIGPLTRKKLIRAFGSTRGVLAAEPSELQAVLGKQRGATLAKYLSSLK